MVISRELARSKLQLARSNEENTVAVATAKNYQKLTQEAKTH